MHILTCSVILGGYPSVDISLVRFWECLGMLGISGRVGRGGRGRCWRGDAAGDFWAAAAGRDLCRSEVDDRGWCMVHWVLSKKVSSLVLVAIWSICYYWLMVSNGFHMFQTFAATCEICVSLGWFLIDKCFFFGGETTKQMRVGRMLGNLTLLSLSMRMER